MGAQLLLVEDDDAIALLLEQVLEREGYEARRVRNGAGALEEVHAAPTDLVILDLGLPDVDGVEVCRRLREDGVELPILMLSARGGELDRVVGLDIGADDYLAKPFSLAELQARIRALLRRSTPRRPTDALDDRRLRLTVPSRTATVAGQALSLTPKEFDLLTCLDHDRGAVVTRERLMDEVWDENWFGSTKTLDVTVGRVRQKLERTEAATRLVTVRGVGFRLEDA
jgi:DNA-binding response OmpR family regulator